MSFEYKLAARRRLAMEQVSLGITWIAEENDRDT